MHYMNHHVNTQLKNSPTTRPLPTGTWQLDPTETTIAVTATKFGFFAVPATLTVSSGSIVIDDDHRVTNVEVVAEAGSYTSRNPKRNTHIRSADFLDADNHPHLVFTAAQVTPDVDGYRAAGSVTVKGEASPIEVDITNVEFDADRGTFTATATVDRNAIGVGKLPSLVIARRLQLKVTATAVVDA